MSKHEFENKSSLTQRGKSCTRGGRNGNRMSLRLSSKFCCRGLQASQLRKARRPCVGCPGQTSARHDFMHFAGWAKALLTACYGLLSGTASAWLEQLDASLTVGSFEPRTAVNCKRQHKSRAGFGSIIFVPAIMNQFLNQFLNQLVL